jgi:riboflavin synthase
MFTGIIKTIGIVEGLSHLEKDIEITVRYSNLNNIEIGDSICVNGICLTVIKFTKTLLYFHVSKETISKVVNFHKSQHVNLEESLSVGDKIGGHFIFGHVDGQATIQNIVNESECQIWFIKIDAKLKKYIAPKGSVSLNGVSLTVNNIKNDIFTVNLIPHTIENTNFKYLKINELINFEVDMLARYALNG